MPALTRREWVLATACWAQILRAQTSGPHFRFFTAASAGAVDALSEAILPGARDAGVIRFIDGALAGYDKSLEPAYLTGIAETEVRRQTLFSDSRSIASLTTAQCDTLAADIEKTEFFQMVRRHTILGFFGHPRHGGNRGGASAKLLGIQESMMYSPPFGFYDAEAAK